jgi:predicted Rossmann fold flavoprotein
MTTIPVDHTDIAIVGAGAAGLFASIFAGRANPNRAVVALDGARKLGAKILVSGGGRCNVTHDEVDERAYAGSSRNAIKKVLRRFDVPQTVAFFRELGVELKREETGKLFPITDDADSVLNALLTATRAARVRLLHPYRVETVARNGNSFTLSGEWGALEAQHVILATGGRSLPKTGSDGGGYRLAQSLGHTLTRRVFPALVPLTLPRGHFITELSGITLPATVEVHAATGKRLAAFTNSTLLTHFGLSGPSILDISRYYTDAKLDDPRTTLVINWLPERTTETIERDLQTLGRTTLLRYGMAHLPERLVRALCADADLEPGTSGDQLTREQRRAFARTLTALPLPITGDRGYTYAEVTAGGVPLSEIHLDTMESRVCPGLHLCGELCDVDGRIGGYNFQWAWASGYVAGVSIG